MTLPRTNRPVCIDCGGPVAEKKIVRCRHCYKIASQAGVSVRRYADQIYDMKSEWRTDPDGTRVRFIGDLTEQQGA